MKSRIQLAWLMVGIALTISRLAAQDVIVTDPAWFDPENPPADVLPQFKKRPKPDFPSELKKPEQVAYAIMAQVIDEKGDNLSWMPLSTNPHAEKVVEGGLMYSPATREGKAVTVHCWFGVIFNPRSASPKKEDATPRLLAVAPITVQKMELPTGAKTPLVIWATLSLDEKGALQNFIFDEPTYEKIRKQVGDSLHVWRFAPARRGGQPMAAELHVPLILTEPFFELKIGDALPKAVHREQAVYPPAMKASGLRGEVLVEFIVAKTGEVTNPVVLRSNNPGFNEAAIEALMKWKFKPGRVGGDLVAARMQQPFIFEMDYGPVHDFATVTSPSKKDQQKLPPEYQYDVAPQPKGVLVPVYPYPFLRDNVDGRASVVFLVDAEGRVADLNVTEATKLEFGLAMVAAVEAFSFVPAIKDGKPAQAILKMQQAFIVSDFSTDKDEELIKLEKKHPEKIFSAKKLDLPLTVVSQRAPNFPFSVRDRFIRGEAKIEFLVDEEGKVHLPRIIEATDPAFGYAAIQAVVAWRFQPPKNGGKPAVVRVRVPFKFEPESHGEESGAKTSEFELKPIDSSKAEAKQL